MTELELYEQCFTELCDSKDAHYAAAHKGNYSVPIVDPVGYAELAKDTVFTVYVLNSRGQYIKQEMTVKMGTTVRVLMFSTLGDMGITTDLDATHGYQFRVLPGRGTLINCRRQR